MPASWGVNPLGLHTQLNIYEVFVYIVRVMTNKTWTSYIIALIKRDCLEPLITIKKKFFNTAQKVINFRLYLGDVTLLDVNLGYMQRHLGAAKESSAKQC